jgi:hypothetical protein
MGMELMDILKEIPAILDQGDARTKARFSEIEQDLNASARPDGGANLR